VTRLRALLVCPGRGSYGRAQLGSLPAGDPIVAALDDVRARLHRPTLRALDSAPEYTPHLHVAGEHASLLTFACTAVDVAAIAQDRIDIVGVTGNSLGFYTALYAAGALDLDGAARLIETLGHYQAGNVIGAQLLYPLTDDSWRPTPDAAAHASTGASGDAAGNAATLTATQAVHTALDHPGVHVSIRLGGTIVLGVDADGLAHARRVLPPLERGGLRYPLQLPLHSAFHTPLMAPTAQRARADLADLAIRSPSITLIGGDGVVHRPWASPSVLWSYTLGPQLVEPFDFTLAITTALGELGPDVIILPGPGDSLGSAIAQILIARRWRGLADRADFTAAQASDRPILLAMHRPEQRARVVQ
jgi:[acyl-carrier-protein] S-malonyltransferase